MKRADALRFEYDDTGVTPVFMVLGVLVMREIGRGPHVIYQDWIRFLNSQLKILKLVDENAVEPKDEMKPTDAIKVTHKKTRVVVESGECRLSNLDPRMWKGTIEHERERMLYILEHNQRT